ncbi:SGNH hydrolase-type esterase domain-containing protein [Lactifluus subvellereus]|nr:SGNH hydrolase-type esterase domain-containing protein [Lactifluus subvellereus]
MAASCQDMIVLFGDSLTQKSWDPELKGIGARLANLYARKLDVVNRGFSGYNTDWALPVLEQIIAKREYVQPQTPHVRLLTIWFGANDACLPGFIQHVPVSRFSENLTTMVRAIRAPDSPWYSPETKLLLITPPPVHVPSMGTDMQPTRTFNVTKAYAEEVKKVGEREDVPVVDAWTRVWEAARKNEEEMKAYFTDGLHLGEAGYKIVFSALQETIILEYPELYHENLQSVFPLWDYFHSHTLEEFKAENWVGERSRIKE